MPFSMTLPFSTNTLIISLLCLGIFFSLPTQEFFRGQGKIKVGTGTETMTPNFSKITEISFSNLKISFPPALLPLFLLQPVS